MSKQQSSYTLKKRRGLVPHLYNPTSPSYQRGAWKNWPRQQPGESDDYYERRRAKDAARETPSANGYIRGHCFTGGK